MNTIEQKLHDLNQLVIDGKLLEAFDKYYHDDVTMQENTQAPTVGKEANRAREQEFLNNVTDFRHASVQGLAAGNDISFVIWTYDYTHKEWGVRHYTQIAVQHWRDGKIIRETFHYNN